MSDVMAVMSGNTSGSDSPLAFIGFGVFAAFVLTVMFFRNRRK
jgi:hypothetical protein